MTEEPFGRVRRLATETGLPGIETGTSYGTPALRGAGKVIAALKDAQTLYLPCPVQQKELLLETAPEIHWQTDHYRGLLVRLAEIGDGERLSEGWERRTTRKLRSEAAR